jgi:parallel beta-helix repeat protein
MKSGWVLGFVTGVAILLTLGVTYDPEWESLFVQYLRTENLNVYDGADHTISVADVDVLHDADLDTWIGVSPSAPWQDILDGTTTTIANVRTIRDQLGRAEINVKTDYGAKGDAVSGADGNSIATNPTFSSATATWVAGDVGKPITIAGVGVAGAPLSTTIASRNSTTSVELTVAPSTTVTGTAAYTYGTDDTVAIQAAIDAVAPGGKVWVPAGVYICSALLELKSNMTLSGTGKGSHLKFTSVVATNSFLHIYRLQNVTVENLYIDGNRFGRLTGGGDSENGSTILIENDEGTYIPRENNVTIRNNDIASCGFCGVTLWNAHCVTVENNRIFDAHDTGINVQYASSRFNITGNFVSGCLIGLAVSNMGYTPDPLVFPMNGSMWQGVVSHNNLTMTTGTYGMWVEGVEESIFAYNNISTTGESGSVFYGIRIINVALPSGNQFVGNDIHFFASITGSGIDVTEIFGADNRYDGNVIRSDVANSAVGFNLYDSQANVSGSLIKNMYVGIYLEPLTQSFTYVLSNNQFVGNNYGIRGVGTAADKSVVYLRDNLFTTDTYAITLSSQFIVHFSGAVPTVPTILTPFAWKSTDWLFYDAAPTDGTWTVGEVVWNKTPTATVATNWTCQTSGTFSTATDATGDTDGSTAVITGMADTSDFSVGDYVTVSAGFATTGPYLVLSKTTTSMTLSAASNAAQSNITVATPDPVFLAAAGVRYYNGKWGFGTETPGAPLEIGASGYDSGIMFSRGANTAKGYVGGFGTADGAVSLLSANGYVNAAGAFVQTETSQPSWSAQFDARTSQDNFYIGRRPAGGSDVKFVYIQNDGKVGFGENSPDHKLDVVGDVNNTGSYMMDGRTLFSDCNSVTATLDPNSMNATGDIETVVFADTALGDEIVAIPPYDLQGIMVTAYVKSAGLCKVVFYKPSAGAVDLASGAWKLYMRRH